MKTPRATAGRSAGLAAALTLLFTSAALAHNDGQGPNEDPAKCVKWCALYPSQGQRSLCERRCYDSGWLTPTPVATATSTVRPSETTNPRTIWTYTPAAAATKTKN